MFYEIWVGLRYAGFGSGRRQGRDRFVSFIAASSMAGIALGVAALIVVLSVMNGFQRDVRDRMLSVLPHVEVFVSGKSVQQALNTLPELTTRVLKNKHVAGAAPFVASQGMLARGRVITGVQIRGVNPDEEPDVSTVNQQMINGSLSDLRAGSFNLAIGSSLASQLNVKTGDKVMVMAPQGSVSPAGFTPRVRQFHISGIFSSGHYEFDSTLVFMNIKDAAVMFRDNASSGVRLHLSDMYKAQAVAQELNQKLPIGNYAQDWSQNNKTWFAAVQTEKRMMFLILTLIIAVAAFNLLSSLVMAVKDKQSDIAILRTLGSTPRQVARIFLVQGAIIGITGTISGVALGALVAYNIDVIVPFIERLLGIEFLPQQIYFISTLPSDPQIFDITIIGATSCVLSLLATLYPSWRASRLQPAQVLRYD